MKNFPHQINDLPKFRAALSVFSDLSAARADLDDDATVGVAMARARIYTFRNRALSVQQALVQEQRKPPGSQGTRTFARDLRRFFVLAGLLVRSAAGRLAVSDLGRHLLSQEPGSDAAKQVWRAAVRRLALGEGHDVSHPYRVLLRLVAALPGIQAARLALALDAQDDTETEFGRILGLARARDWNSVLRRLGVSDHQARNAIKILPALARQVGDVREENGRYYLVGEAPAGRPRRRVRRLRGARRTAAMHRTVTPITIATSPIRSDRSLREEEYADPELSAELRHDRLTRHQELVRQVGAVLADEEYELHEDPYDALATHRERPSLLVEAKTLDGSPPDESAQVRAVIGQLFYYEHFEVPPDMRRTGLILVAIFERRPSEEHITLLESLHIVAIWRVDDSLEAAPWSRGQLQAIGLVRDA